MHAAFLADQIPAVFVVIAAGDAGLRGVIVGVLIHIEHNVAVGSLGPDHRIAGFQQRLDLGFHRLDFFICLLAGEVVAENAVLHQIPDIPGDICLQPVAKCFIIGGTDEGGTVQIQPLLGGGCLRRQGVAAAGGDLQHPVHAQLVILQRRSAVHIGPGCGQQNGLLLFFGHGGHFLIYQMVPKKCMMFISSIILLPWRPAKPERSMVSTWTSSASSLLVECWPWSGE